jgi:hypothetical protein
LSLRSFIAIALGMRLPPGLGLVLVAIGAGFVRPCTFAAAAEIMAAEDVSSTGDAAAPSARRFTAVTAIAMAVYCAVNLGALSSTFAGATARSVGFRYTAFVTGLSALVAAAALGGSGLLGRGRRAPMAAAPTDPYRSAPARPAPRQVANDALVAGAILLAPALLYGVALDLSFPVMSGEWGYGASARWLFVVNPAVVTAGTGVLCGLFCVLTMTRSSLSPLFVAGVGLGVLGVGLVPSALANGAIVAAVGAFLVGVGESLVGPTLYAHAALATRPRHAALATAAMMFVGTAPAQVLHAVATTGARAPVLLLLALLTLGGGVALAIFARGLQRLFEPSYSNATS